MMDANSIWSVRRGSRCHSSSVTKGMKGCSSLHRGGKDRQKWQDRQTPRRAHLPPDKTQKQDKRLGGRATTQPSLKPIGYDWSYLTCRVGHSFPDSQPYIGSSLQICRAASPPPKVGGGDME
jgi:hypothetical protein